MSCNESFDSATLEITTKDSTNPSKPENLEANSITQTSATLNWNASTDNVSIAGYYIYDNNEQVASTDSNTYTFSNLTPGTKYRFSISAVDGYGNISDKSDVVEVNTLDIISDDEAPGAPGNIVLEGVTDTSINISWAPSIDNFGISKYHIYVDGKLENNVDGNINFYEIKSLKPDTIYTITIVAEDFSNNLSETSEALTAKTVSVKDNSSPSTPSGVTATSKTKDSINLSWVASTDNVGVTNYDVYINGTMTESVAGIENTSLVSGLTRNKL